MPEFRRQGQTAQGDREQARAACTGMGGAEAYCQGGRRGSVSPTPRGSQPQGGGGDPCPAGKKRTHPSWRSSMESGSGTSRRTFGVAALAGIGLALVLVANVLVFYFYLHLP